MPAATTVAMSAFGEWTSRMNDGHWGKRTFVRLVAWTIAPKTGWC